MITGILIGFILALLLYLLSIYIKPSTKYTTLTDPTTDPEFHELQTTPHCPYCQSYNLKLINDNAQVPWLSTRIPELDHYQCQRCYETFSDENWQNTVIYNNQPHNDD